MIFVSSHIPPRTSPFLRTPRQHPPSQTRSLHRRAAQIRLERYKLDRARLGSDGPSRRADAGMRRLAGEIGRTRRLLEGLGRRSPGTSAGPAVPLDGLQMLANIADSVEEQKLRRCDVT